MYPRHVPGYDVFRRGIATTRQREPKVQVRLRDRVAVSAEDIPAKPVVVATESADPSATGFSVAVAHRNNAFDKVIIGFFP